MSTAAVFSQQTLVWVVAYQESPECSGAVSTVSSAGGGAVW